MSDDGRRSVTTRTYAKFHGVHIKTVLRWIDEGRVQAVKSPGGYRWRVLIGVKSREQTDSNGNEAT